MNKEQTCNLSLCKIYSKTQPNEDEGYARNTPSRPLT